MEEELAFAVWIVVGEVPLRVLGNVQADEIDLAVADVAEGTLKLAFPSRSDLTSVPVSTSPASKRSRRWNS